MITRDEVLMGRDAIYPLDAELESNLGRLLESLNKFRAAFGAPMYVSSGYRPGHFNTDAGGAKGSAHMSCEACDFKDPTGAIDFFAHNNQELLAECGLYLEDPAHSPGWSHLTTRRPLSGRRVFIP